MKTFFKILLIFFIIFSAISGFFAAKIFSGKKNLEQKIKTEKVFFEVFKNQTLKSILNDFEKLGFIKDAKWSYYYLRFTGGFDHLKAGKYKIEKDETAISLLKKFSNGNNFAKTTRFTIPEGNRISQIDSILFQKGIFEKGKIIEETKNVEKYKTKFPFLIEILPVGTDSLEGFLFPDTYEFVGDLSEEIVVSKMIETFKIKVFDVKLLENENLTKYEVLTLASIVQKESGKEVDSAGIAGVFMNRIRNGMKLQSDVTLLYEVPIEKFSTKNPSLYNTYYHFGLPPTPITNPGKISIDAIKNAENSEYFYFFADHEGVTRFSKTLVEHNAQIAKYGLAGVE
ncbi:MAG: endolytic transglycosylase MltG [Patescibacteria group bacterium]